MATKKNTTPDNTIFYPPVVTVLGHVDHGKTSLLDAIRKTNIAGLEHGGITQKIGASNVEILHDGVKRRITFIDTPGHEAFGQMRSRGAQAADIGLLIVSLVDGVAPQTKESILLLQAAKLPFIVVLTKSDVPDTNAEKVKQQLTKENVMLEGYGGQVPVIAVSSKTNTNIKELLDLILLVMEVKGQSEHVSKSGKFAGIVIESRQDAHAGPRATVVVKNGTLKIREEIECEGIAGRSRMLINDAGKNLQEISIGDAVEILGFEKVPPVGAIVAHKGQSEIVEQEIVEIPETTETPIAFSPFAVSDESALAILLVTDTLGSLEAIKTALPAKVKIMLDKTGDISSADILFAKSVKALILGFNVKVKPEIKQLAAAEKVLIRTYTLIYEMLDEIKDVLEGKRLALIEEIYGKGKILATFPFEKKIVLGVSVLEGRIAKNDKIRIMRGDEIIGESSIASLRQGKNVVSKVEAPGEAGIILSGTLDFTIGDVILCHG